MILVVGDLAGGQAWRRCLEVMPGGDDCRILLRAISRLETGASRIFRLRDAVLGQGDPMLDVVCSPWRVRFMSGDISEEHPEERFHAS